MVAFNCRSKGRTHCSPGLNPQIDTVPVEVGVGGDVSGDCGHRPRVNARQCLFTIGGCQQHVGHAAAPDRLSGACISSPVHLGFAVLTGLCPHARTPSGADRDSPGYGSCHGPHSLLDFADADFAGYELWEEQITQCGEGAGLRQHFFATLPNVRRQRVECFD